MSAQREFPLVLQLDKAGNPQAWIDHEASCYHYAKGNVAWAMGEVEFDVRGGTSAKTGKQSILTINTIVALKGELNKKAIMHYTRVPLSNKTLFSRDANTCAYCGDHFASHSKLSRDHIMPVSRNGPNGWNNVVTACHPCNKRKDNRTPDEATMPLMYVPYVPSRHEWLILANRKILADQMEFLMKNVPANSRLRQ